MDIKSCTQDTADFKVWFEQLCIRYEDLYGTKLVESDGTDWRFFYEESYTPMEAIFADNSVD